MEKIIIRRKTKKWTKIDILFLEDNYRYMTNKVLASKLKHPQGSVRQKLGDLGLKRNYEYCEYREGVIVNNQYNNPWSNEEINILKENYNLRDNHEIKEMLPRRTVGAISQKLNTLNLRRTDDFIKKIYKKRSGKNNHNYGKKLTQERIEQIRKRNTKNLDMEYIKKSYLSGKSINSISKELKVANSNIWKKLKRIGVKTRSQGLIGKKVSLETRNKMRLANIGKTHTKTTINKIRIVRSKQIFPKKDSSIELKIQNFLKQLGIEFFTHQYMKIEHGYQCDILIPSMNLIIECDGDYWHMNPNKFKPEDRIFKNGMTAQERWDLDKARTDELMGGGFKVWRLWEHEINDMVIEDFKEKISRERIAIMKGAVK